MRAMWGRFLLRRGELAGAEALFAEALRIAPDLPFAQAQRAELLLRTGKAKEAAALFEAAFASSRQVRYLMDQARALELAGDKVNADTLRAQVETIVRGELGENGLGHRLDLVETLIDRGSSTRIAEAVKLAREEVAKRPSAEARYQLARALAGSGAVEDAAREIQGALATGAKDAQIYELASRIEKLRKSTARAAMYSKLAQELDPGASGWRQMGMP
jgi:tetratricopeptide (TPR) repeat protein